MRKRPDEGSLNFNRFEALVRPLKCRSFGSYPCLRARLLTTRRAVRRAVRRGAPPSKFNRVAAAAVYAGAFEKTIAPKLSATRRAKKMLITFFTFFLTPFQRWTESHVLLLFTCPEKSLSF